MKNEQPPDYKIVRWSESEKNDEEKNLENKCQKAIQTMQAKKYSGELLVFYDRGKIAKVYAYYCRREESDVKTIEELRKSMVKRLEKCWNPNSGHKCKYCGFQWGREGEQHD